MCERAAYTTSRSLTRPRCECLRLPLSGIQRRLPFRIALVREVVRDPRSRQSGGRVWNDDSARIELILVWVSIGHRQPGFSAYSKPQRPRRHFSLFILVSSIVDSNDSQLIDDVRYLGRRITGQPRGYSYQAATDRVYARQ